MRGTVRDVPRQFQEFNGDPSLEVRCPWKHAKKSGKDADAPNSDRSKPGRTVRNGLRFGVGMHSNCANDTVRPTDKSLQLCNSLRKIFAE